jgi:methylamine--corrinoid protein Co-methyltransferase
MMGEASMAACGMDVHELNQVIERSLSIYEKSYNDVPRSKHFMECYDVDEIRPTEEYLAVYDGALNVLSNCGIDF